MSRENLAREIRQQLGEFNDDDKPLYVLIEALVANARAGSQLSALRLELNDAHQQIRSLRAFKQSVDEALNIGDGSYRP